MPETSGGAWTEWHGGGCPVGCGTIVDVRFRDGIELSRADPVLLTHNWKHDPRTASCDIIAYRVRHPVRGDENATD